MYSFLAFTILLKKYKICLIITKYCFHHSFHKILINRNKLWNLQYQITYLSSSPKIFKQRKTLNQRTKIIQTLQVNLFLIYQPYPNFHVLMIPILFIQTSLDLKLITWKKKLKNTLLLNVLKMFRQGRQLIHIIIYHQDYADYPNLQLQFIVCFL